MTIDYEPADYDYPCDSCTCCTHLRCHTGPDSGCPVSSSGDFVCPCTAD